MVIEEERRARRKDVGGGQWAVGCGQRWLCLLKLKIRNKQLKMKNERTQEELMIVEC